LCGSARAAGEEAVVSILDNSQKRTKAGTAPFSSIGDLVACQARRASERIAILGCEGWSITYGTLWASLNDTVDRLRRVGVRRTDRVAVVLPGGPETAVAIIAVAAGAVCVPLNPSFTEDEWRRYFAELGAAALLTRADVNSASRRVAQTLGIPVIEVWTELRGSAGVLSTEEHAKRPTLGNEFACGADDAFILLTSGSTSRPKMVPLTHASVCLSARNVGANLTLRPDDRLLNVLPLFHGHGLISGVLAALAAGSSVVCTEGFNADAFFGWVTKFRPTWYTAVPSIHQAVLSVADTHKHLAQRSSFRVIRSASSTLTPKLLCGLEGLFGVPVIDTYGMTEAATQIAANSLRRRKLGSVGQPAGAEIAILGAEGRPASSGERGEIVLRGPTITRGYNNDAAATAAAFQDGWFRTGDLGYIDADGYLFIVGRIKDVINRGGQKVAPAEVEEVLSDHPDVVEAAVFPIPHPRLETDIAAAVVLRRGAKVTAQKLRRFVGKRLASFKVPGLIRIVQEIPKGAGGKIKRGELATAANARAERRRRMATPRSDLERQLAQLWADLLEIKQIGTDQDIFTMGADSIAVTQLISRLRERFGVKLSFGDVFGAPTVRALATRVDSASRRLAPSSPRDLPRARAEGNSPSISIVQERMLRIEREIPRLAQFNLPFAYRLQGPLNVPALKRSLAELASRHESLRTGFHWREGLPVAGITAAADIKIPVITDDLASRAPSRNPRTKALLLRKVGLEIEQESLKPFDITQPPLFRARLFRLASDDHVLLLVVHDITIDGWSMGIFMQEVSEFYTAFAAGKQPQVPEASFQFSDFASWQRRWSTTNEASRQFDYWKKYLRKAVPVFASTPDIAAELASCIARERLQISNEQMARLSHFSHSRGVTLFMTLLAGFKTLLMLRTGRNDLCVATMMANRSYPGAERVIGPFANTTLIRTQLDADLTFQEALKRVRGAVMEAYTRQELPFDIIAQRLAKETGVDPASLTQVHFVLQAAFRRPVKLLDMAVRPFGYRQGQTFMPIDRTWLAMTLSETHSEITGACTYKKDLLQPSSSRWVADYKAILAQATANPAKSLGRLAGD
jgi:acyl-CoA synthetase (AMP-forming)/AMP-acid ligase II/acyl carrier protein